MSNAACTRTIAVSCVCVYSSARPDVLVIGVGRVFGLLIFMREILGVVDIGQVFITTLYGCVIECAVCCRLIYFMDCWCFVFGVWCLMCVK